VGRLVDADMNEVSTRLKALQTQQQLGLQSLSIANAKADSVLQLYR
jgi:flagellin